MQIDNYAEAQALTEKLAANVPITVTPTKQLVKTLRQQGETIDPKQSYEIDSVLYSGDMGGITCVLKGGEDGKSAYVVSITHLTIDPDHPLAPEVEAYQQQRARMLAIQDSKGFAAELLAARSAKTKKKRRSKGFGA